MRFLSDEWLTALSEAARSITVDPDASVVIEQTVRGAGGDVVWHTRVGDGEVRIVPGPAPDPDVSLSCDPETAASISLGRLSGQKAFLDGRLRLDGDIRSLIAARPALAVVSDTFAAVRARLDDQA